MAAAADHPWPCCQSRLGSLLFGISMAGLFIGTTSYDWIITNEVIWQKLFRGGGVFATGLAGLA
jgi:hypothetical protein